MSAVLKKGSQGPEVVELKRLLEVWGKTHPLPKPLAKTPVFGEATVIDVKAFQESAGLTGDGKVGDLTWGAPPSSPAEESSSRRFRPRSSTP